jgi:carbonic anhydrase
VISDDAKEQIMDAVETLTQRNAQFAAHRFTSGLKMMPSLRTIIIGCVDPRVDPARILGIDLGEVAVIRNIGGRVTAVTVQELELLRNLARATGSDLDQGWNLIILQHTDCGIVRLQSRPEMLASYLGVDEEDLAARRVGDPVAAVGVDVAALRAAPELPNGSRVSGLVYDVATGRIETVATPSMGSDRPNQRPGAAGRPGASRSRGTRGLS